MRMQQAMSCELLLRITPRNTEEYILQKATGTWAKVSHHLEVYSNSNIIMVRDGMTKYGERALDGNQVDIRCPTQCPHQYGTLYYNY